MDKAELLGALISLAQVSDDHPKRSEWKIAGEEMFESTKPKKTKRALLRRKKVKSSA